MKIIVEKLKRSISENICLIPSEIFNSLNLNINGKYKLCVGLLSEEVYFKPSYSDSEKMYFPIVTFNNLQLFSRVKLNIWRDESNIYLGPVVGVFVNDRYLKSISDDNPPLSCQKHIQANSKGNCLLYYFSIDGINWFDKKIKGFVFSPRFNEWKKYWLPMPNVVYDRGVAFDKLDKSLVYHIRNSFKKNPDIHFINSSDYLGKWQIYNRLQKYDEITEHLPYTIRYDDFSSVKNMLNKYNFIFIKSYYGSRGTEVMSIKENKKGFVTNFYKNGLKKVKFKTLDELKNHVEEFIKDKKFIVQQGIMLLKYKKRSVDLRVLIEKNDLNEWVAVYNQARIAVTNQNITNTSAGGDILNYSDIYSNKDLTNNKKLPSDIEIREKTIEIAKFIEKEYGSFGELGMDIAIDTKGKIWFIEANTKPDKDPEPGLEDTIGISPQCLLILKYSNYLVKGRDNSE